MTEPVPAMARVVREDPGEPAVLLVCPSNGPPLRFLLTLQGRAVLMEDVAASVAEDVRRAVVAVGCRPTSVHRADQSGSS